MTIVSLNTVRLLYDPPITPTLVPLSPNTVQDVTALTEAIRTLPALGVLALLIMGGILYILFVARKQPADSEPLNNQIKQSSALIKQIEDERSERREERQIDRAERKEIMDDLLKRDREKDAAMTESLSALTAAWESNRARDVTFAAQMSMLTAGVTEPEPIKSLLDSAEIMLTAAKSIETKMPLLSELRTAIEAVTETLAYLKQKENDSRPVQTVTLEPQPDHNGNKAL